MTPEDLMKIKFRIDMGSAPVFRAEASALFDEVVRLNAQVKAQNESHNRAMADYAAEVKFLRAYGAGARERRTLDAVRALCDQAERNYGGSPGMANLEAWVHLGSLRRALDGTT